MPSVRLRPESSVLLVVDIQEALLGSIWDIDRVVDRSRFLIRIAQLLGVPIVSTEQNPSRMGKTESSLLTLIGEPHAKMAFSACGSLECAAELDRLRSSDSQSFGRSQVVVVGIETHICVSQTAHDLLEEGFEVVVCPDAVSARSAERHKLGMERIRDAGVVPAHTESVAYEWLRSADHPKFRDALKIVKEHP